MVPRHVDADETGGQHRRDRNPGVLEIAGSPEVSLPIGPYVFGHDGDPGTPTKIAEPRRCDLQTTEAVQLEPTPHATGVEIFQRLIAPHPGLAV